MTSPSPEPDNNLKLNGGHWTALCTLLLTAFLFGLTLGHSNPCPPGPETCPQPMPALAAPEAPTPTVAVENTSTTAQVASPSKTPFSDEILRKARELAANEQLQGEEKDDNLKARFKYRTENEHQQLLSLYETRARGHKWEFSDPPFLVRLNSDSVYPQMYQLQVELSTREKVQFWVRDSSFKGDDITTSLWEMHCKTRIMRCITCNPMEIIAVEGLKIHSETPWRKIVPDTIGEGWYDWARLEKCKR